jgi:hypothetical protein
MRLIPRRVQKVIAKEKTANERGTCPKISASKEEGQHLYTCKESSEVQ